MSGRPPRPARRLAAGTEARLPSEQRVLRRPGARRFTPRTEDSPGAHKAAACAAPPGGRRPLQEGDPAAGPGTPGAAPSALSEGPPAPGSAGATRAASAALDHVHGFPSLNAEQVSCRGCAAGGRGDAAETPAAGTPARRCPRCGAPLCSRLASVAASGVPRGAPGSWPSSESSRDRARGTYAGCGPFSRPQAGAG